MTDKERTQMTNSEHAHYERSAEGEAPESDTLKVGTPTWYDYVASHTFRPARAHFDVDGHYDMHTFLERHTERVDEHTRVIIHIVQVRDKAANQTEPQNEVK